MTQTPVPDPTAAEPAPAPAGPTQEDSGDCAGKTSRACDLLKGDKEHLKEVYTQAAPGAIPDGESHGRATLSPGTAADVTWQKVLGLAWKGKVFHRIDATHGELSNKTPIGDIAGAKVAYGKSLVDGKPAIILDYSHSEVVLARGIRDEIRMVGPDLYLGYAYVWLPLHHKYVLWLPFALDFSK